MLYCTFQVVFQKLSAKVRKNKFETVIHHVCPAVDTFLVKVSHLKKCLKNLFQYPDIYLKYF